MANEKPLSKREIKKAALMFNIATLCQLNGDAATDEQIDVAEEANKQAWDLWHKHFPKLEMPLNFQACIDAVKGMRE